MARAWYYRELEATTETPVWLLVTDELEILAQIYPGRKRRKPTLIMPNFKRCFATVLNAKNFATQHYEGLENEAEG